MFSYKFINIFFIGLVFSAMAGAVDVKEIRQLYKEAPNDEDKAEGLWKMLSEEEVNPLLLAYKGATRAILAKHVWMVTTKYSYAKEGMSLLNQAIQREQENIEIRYLRFTIQYHLPSFLGLSKDLEEDKKAFLNYMCKRLDYSIEESHFKEMAKFFIQSGKCSEVEIKKLKSEAGI